MLYVVSAQFSLFFLMVISAGVMFIAGLFDNDNVVMKAFSVTMVLAFLSVAWAGVLLLTVIIKGGV